MKKFLPYIIVILVLAGAVTWFLLHRNSGSFSNMEHAFALKDRKSISKIVLTDTDHKKLELNDSAGAWIVNGKYIAREELVQSLLEVITRVTTLCPVPSAAHDIVLKNMMEKNIKVEVYTGKNDQAVKTYYVGGPNAEGRGTYMVLEEDGKIQSRAYITYLPGLQGYLTPRYNMDEENWKTREVFKGRPDDIQSLSVEYAADESKSFTLTRAAKDSFVLAPSDEKFRINQDYKQQYIREYLSFYNSIYIEVFDNSNPQKDSILQTTPYCIFTLTGTNNRVNRVKVFYMPINRRSKMQEDAKGTPMTRDIDRFYASMHNDKDFAVIQYYVFGKLLRNYKDFFFKPGKPGV